MPGLTVTYSLTLAARIIGAAVLAVLLFGFYRQYRKIYLRHWTFAWAALTVHHLAAAVRSAMWATGQLAPLDPPMLGLTMLAGAGGYLHAGFFLFGVWEMVKRRPVRIIESRRILMAILIGGIVTAFINVGPPDLSGRNVARYGLYLLLSAAAFLIAAVALWRTRRGRHGIGFIVLAVACAAYALEQLHYLGLGVLSILDAQREYPMYLGYFDFLLQSIIGVGMIACLLEDEREAAELAAGEIEHLAYHDALTGLPNRPLFMDRLIVAVAQANRAGTNLAVFFLDLDRFKDINDSLGHSVGDTLLKAVAERMRRCVREGDTVARFGGDEFTLLIPRINSIEDTAKIAQKVIDALHVPFVIHERELFVTASVGVGIYPSDGLDPETLVRNADTAMYRAKDQGRDGYQLYAPAMNARALERLALENMLRKAISQEELVLYYQPQIDASSRVVGVEALVRWRHPEMGLLSPGDFIGVAEMSGLIIPIGDWTLHTACRQLKAWQRQRRLDDEFTVAVNLSARQFQQPNLVKAIREVVEETEISPSSLEIEITESNAMQNAENTIYTLRELKDLGIRISMDDFGTGYSSLNYLKRFPIDTLKLDQSFVRDVATDPSDAAIVSAVIQMAHSLDLKVVAEGVETREQLEFLRRQRCDIFQGFLFAPPLPTERLETYLAERRTANA
jgi:diguanylate cyclase (GGDEF)-like protein